jgi:Fe2+ or Zn2+ uptake regulation protein
MTVLNTLEETVREGHPASSRAMACAIYRRVSQMLADGQPPQAIYDALDVLYRRFRDDGHPIERDAMVEALDWFEDEGVLHST